ncbi:CaiB/BaiF CoA-transferase family protein [Nocardioides sp. Arc9.136]|uniref:CaiB/BaiF CoA transferase family protein n=1 Tax=Nocardioides sp. Arc9.136 TaxID=2996826 RepID=UPI0026652237|nr:CoA transferase [Nocardioides sp. Arc9.136]WKN48747.1 CoA transferase [Nocardioides sp. Arc9.136]
MLEPDDLPLAGTTVLDFSQFLAGPVAALRLADLGARVIKVERPVTGEIGRTLAFAGRWKDGDTLSFHAMNRGKEAVVADLKDPGDLARVKALVARADVLIQNFRPGVMERIGLDPAAAMALNPGLVYASASGYGADGPWAGRPGQDLLAQSVAALPWVTATGDRPVPVGLAIADHLMSCHIAEGVTALLVRKARTGRGGLVETSLLEGVLDLQVELLTARLNDPALASGRGPHSAHGYLPAPYGLYPTADGHLAIAMAPVDRLGRLLGVEELAARADPAAWWDDRARIERLLADRLRTAPTRRWLEVLDAADVWCAPVLTLEQLIEHPAFEAVGMTQVVERPPAEPGGEPVRLTTTRSPIRIDGEVLTSGRAAPRLGAQGRLADGADPFADPFAAHGDG